MPDATLYWYGYINPTWGLIGATSANGWTNAYYGNMATENANSLYFTYPSNVVSQNKIDFSQYTKVHTINSNIAQWLDLWFLYQKNLSVSGGVVAQSELHVYASGTYILDTKNITLTHSYGTDSGYFGYTCGRSGGSGTCYAIWFE